MPSSASSLKAELRAAMKEKIARMSDQGRSTESRTLCQRILAILPEDIAICAFVPLKTEPDITMILQEILRRKQCLYLPACESNDALVFRSITTLASLRPGRHGFTEPSDEAPTLAVDEPIFALIPGRAFDVHGNRLGRGNGGYDRWIAERRKSQAGSTFIGIAFDCQMVESVPMEGHDQQIDGVITGRGLTTEDCIGI